MKNLDTRNPTFVVSPASKTDLEPASRLIVLVPNSELDLALAARKIREVAKAMESRIQLLGLSRDAAHEPGIRRQLVTLAAMIEDPTLMVESKVEYGRDWLNALRFHWHQGDVIVCFAEQLSNASGTSLSNILERELNTVVYVIGEIKRHHKNQTPVWLYNLLAWAGSIALIVGFFGVQANLVQTPQNVLHTLLFYISLFAEVGLIWLWNQFFDQRIEK